jgi:hypothetical protein
MLGTARASTYSWLFVLITAAVIFFFLRPAHSEDYGSGLAMMAVVVGAAALCLFLAIIALAAYFVAWRRAQPFLVHDKVLVVVSFVGLAVFAWPFSWLVGG